MTPASSNYKIYSRQPRTLTEETGFSGGMFWAGNNNIDSSHLKAIVNFDYDDTTGFLKTRAPLVPNVILDKDEQPIKLYSPTYHYLGCYELCPTKRIGYGSEAYTGLDSAGELHLFGQCAYDRINNIQRWYNVQPLFKTSTGVWYTVDSAEIQHASFEQCNKVKPVLFDNILYFLTGRSSRKRIFTAYRVVTQYETENSLTPSRIYIDRQANTAVTDKNSDWLDYDSCVSNISLLTILNYGFNAARGEDLYIYDSTAEYDTTSNRILGMYMTEKQDSKIPLYSARIGQQVYLHIAINGTTPLIQDTRVVNIYSKVNDTGTVEEDVWRLIAAECDITQEGVCVQYTITDVNQTFAINIAPANADKNTTFYSEDAIERLAPITYYTNDNTLNIKTQPYNLALAKDCCLWKQRLVLWGCDNFKATLFISEPNNFYYFPVPQGVVLTDTDIISCVPYLDSLLVFTVNKLYKISIDSNGSYIQEVIQNNMPMSINTATCVQTIKNMVLFKSGKYFYMVVPKSQSLTGELTIAPIYKNITGLLSDLSQGVFEILSALYPERMADKSNTRIQVPDNPDYIYTIQDTVYMLYNVTTETYSYMLFLNYNTNLRAWTTYLVDTTDQSLYPIKLTVAQTMSFLRVQKNTTNAEGCGLYEATLNPNVKIPNAFRSLIDTGYRTLSASLKKRFREVQLKLYCSSESVTSFGSAFFVDGVTRKNYIQLKEVCLDDQTVTLTPDYSLNTFLIEPTMSIDDIGVAAHLSDNTQQTQPPQGSDAIELDDWKLDFSHFKREAPITVRIPVSGKGYAPRLVLMTPCSLSLCVNEINWVYRIMYGR